MVDYDALSAVVWVVFAGVCFGAFYAYYHRRLLGDLLRSFISAGAQDEQSAKSLSAIGYGEGIKKAFAGFALKKGSVLRKTVCAVYEEKAPVKKHSDELFAKAPELKEEQLYYIPEEKRITAEIRYDGKGATASALVMTVAVFFVAAIVIVSLLPWLVNNYHKFLNPGTEAEDKPEPGYEQIVPDTPSQEENGPETEGAIDYTLPQ